MKILILLTLLLASCQAHAKDFTFIEVYDGDTIKVRINNLPRSLAKGYIRIKGIDSPEKGWRAKCKKELALAKEATLFLDFELRNGLSIEYRNLKWDKYGGRILADVYVDGDNVADMMLSKGFAARYNGRGKKFNWCEND